jgi:hypothetical protein
LRTISAFGQAKDQRTSVGEGLELMAVSEDQGRHQRAPFWQYAGELVLQAADGDKAAIDEIGLQLRRALIRTGSCEAAFFQIEQFGDFIGVRHCRPLAQDR